MNPASSYKNSSFATGIIGGLVDCAHWCHPYEGAYTRLGKLAIVNVLGARDLSMLLFGKNLLNNHARPLHGRSLLAGAWMERGGTFHPLASTIRNAALDQAIGRWTPWISSDQHLRYCPECLSIGFQSAIFQIDALYECPVHKVGLLDTCPNCAKKTTGYALTEEAMSSPLHCRHCNEPFSDAWRRGNEMSHWHELEDDQPFLDMAKWLAEVGRAEINWPDVDTWYGDTGPDVWREDKRCAVFGVLASLFPLPTSICTSAPKLHVYIGTCAAASGTNKANIHSTNEVKLRTGIYKSIRKHVSKTLGVNLSKIRYKRQCRYHVDWYTGAIVPEEEYSNPAEHGLLLWQSRSENGINATALNITVRDNPVATKIRESMIAWPVNWCTDAATWGRFIHLCFLEDQWTAMQWQRDARALNALSHTPGDSDSYRTADLAILMETYSKWMSRLSYKREVWPMSIAAFQWQTSSDDKVLVVVAVDRLKSYENPRPIATDLIPSTCGGVSCSTKKNVNLERPPIAPLDKLVAPPGLEGGGAGDDTARPSDIQLVHNWIMLSESESTAISRRNTAEKLLNWAYFKKIKALSTLTREDFAEFSEFLSNPEPAAWWIQTRTTGRSSAQWAPFAAPLALNSRRDAMVKVGTLTKWFRSQGYANLMCFHQRSALEMGHADSSLSAMLSPRSTEFKCLTEIEWRWIMHTLLMRPSAFGLTLEMKLVIELLYFGELNINELLRLSYADFSKPCDGQQFWCIMVVKKNGKPGRVQYAPPPLSETIEAWFEKSQIDSASPSVKAVEGVNMSKRMCFTMKPNDVHHLIRSIFHHAALQAAGAGDEKCADLLNTRTAMSLRHAFSFHLVGDHDMGFLSPDIDEWAFRQLNGEKFGPFWMKPGSERLWIPIQQDPDHA